MLNRIKLGCVSVNRYRIAKRTMLFTAVNMSKRTTITLPDGIFADLTQWADQEGRPTANLVAFLVELAVKQRFVEKYPEMADQAQGK
jgi:CopG-like RHH_1 or ribbon-helix-helix domain, RHH_5